MDAHSPQPVVPTSLLQRVSWGVLFLVLLGVSGAGIWSVLHGRLATEASAPLPVYWQVPEFHLTERSGQPVTRADLAGKIWVADFVFTRCPGVCPLLSSRMAKLQDALQRTQGSAVMLLSFSVDTEWDTPARLRTYAERYGADPQRWLFLTGDPAAMYRLVTEGFRLSMAQTPSADKEQGPADIVHSDRFVLDDPDLCIRGYYRGTEEDALDRLLHDVETLRREYS